MSRTTHEEAGAGGSTRVPRVRRTKSSRRLVIRFQEPSYYLRTWPEATVRRTYLYSKLTARAFWLKARVRPSQHPVALPVPPSPSWDAIAFTTSPNMGHVVYRGSGCCSLRGRAPVRLVAARRRSGLRRAGPDFGPPVRATRLRSKTAREFERRGLDSGLIVTCIYTPAWKVAL